MYEAQACRGKAEGVPIIPHKLKASSLTLTTWDPNPATRLQVTTVTLPEQTHRKQGVIHSTLSGSRNPPAFMRTCVFRLQDKKKHQKTMTP